MVPFFQRPTVFLGKLPGCGSPEGPAMSVWKKGGVPLEKKLKKCSRRKKLLTWASFHSNEEEVGRV
jgi:hypothetical protein